MNDQKTWMALELPANVLNEVATEAIRLGSTPSSLFEEAWSRSSHRICDAAIEPPTVSRLATRIVLNTQSARDIEHAAAEQDVSISALMGWAWQEQRGYYRTRRTGSLIAIMS